MRIEKDTLGEVGVPDDALYGAQTQRAVENYPISGLREHPELSQLATALAQKGGEVADVIKSGRTHLQDAVPVTLGQEFKAYAAATKRATDGLRRAADEVRELGIGGTATGTGINTPPGYRFAVVKHLGPQFRTAPDLREAMQSQLPVVAVSAALRT